MQIPLHGGAILTSVANPMSMVDEGLVLFVALLVLWFWRVFAPVCSGGKWLEYANYCSLLFVVLAVLLIYAEYLFLGAALDVTGKSSWKNLPAWLRPGIVMTPGVVAVTYFMCLYQAFQHVDKIRRGAAAHQHDRVVQIVILPALYGVMSMSSLTRVYLFYTNPGYDRAIDGVASPIMEARKYNALAMSETCFWVADLYEAWVLYQFGKLTLELIHAGILKKARSAVESERAAANALLLSHGAVESLAWLGILLFMAVNFAKAFWSLYLLTFTKKTHEEYSVSIGQFAAAGSVASIAAIWNIHVVESTFHELLADYWPFTKFITVKILVTFAFFQRACFSVLKAVDGSLPGLMQSVIKKVPLIGDVVHMRDIEFELFYAVMIAFECFIIALAHVFAWKSGELWYDEPELNPFEKDREEEQERRQLVS